MSERKGSRFPPLIRRLHVTLGEDGSVLDHKLVIIPVQFRNVLQGKKEANFLYYKGKLFLGIEVPDGETFNL